MSEKIAEPSFDLWDTGFGGAAAAREYLDSFPRIGRSRLCRSILGEDIDMYTLGSGKRRILYVAAHHGAEHITASLLWFFLSRFASAGSTLHGVDTELYLSSYTLIAVPLLNPDGVSLSLRGPFDNPLSARQERMAGDEGFCRWQANARGVDLNHNYNVGFGEYKRIEEEQGIAPGRSLYSGEYPESEPESRALASLVRSVAPVLSVSLHSQGEELYAYPGDSPIAAAATELFGYRSSIPEGTAAYGGFCDYTASLGIPSLTVEVGKGENPLPSSEYYRIRERVARALFLLPTRL